MTDDGAGGAGVFDEAAGAGVAEVAVAGGDAALGRAVAAGAACAKAAGVEVGDFPVTATFTEVVAGWPAFDAAAGCFAATGDLPALVGVADFADVADFDAVVGPAAPLAPSAGTAAGFAAAAFPAGLADAGAATVGFATVGFAAAGWVAVGAGLAGFGSFAAGVAEVPGLLDLSPFVPMVRHYAQ